MRIVHVLPAKVGEERKQKVQHFLSQAVEASTVIEVVDLKNGPAAVEHHNDCMLATSMIYDMREVLVEYDAVNIACFYDPGLRELREALTIPVMGIGLASMTLASLLGHRFSMIVGQQKHIPKLEDNSMTYGFHSKIASWRSVNYSVEDFRTGGEEIYETILRESKKAIESDRAEVIVLGCGALDTIGQRLQQDLQVPVVNPIIAGIKLCEMMGQLHGKLGLTTSKVNDYRNR